MTVTTTKCPKCKGTGFLEYESGLIRLRCPTCKGEGEVELAEGGLVNGPELANTERIEPVIERTGRPDTVIRGETTRKSRKLRKSKARQVART